MLSQTPWPAAHSLADTLNFVVVVILQDCDGNCVVIFHLQQSSLVAGSDVFHLKERQGFWLSTELGWLWEYLCCLENTGATQ